MKKQNTIINRFRKKLSWSTLLMSAHFASYLLFTLLLLSLWSCSGITTVTKSEIPLTGAYLGQTLPTDTAMLFAPGVVSTGINERDFAMTPDGDEIFFCRETGDFKYTTIFHARQVNGKWTAPEVWEFCKKPAYKYIEPHISPDGTRLYFVSNMPIGNETRGSEDIWYSEKSDGEWSQPKNIGLPINTTTTEYFPSVTKDGTIYYTHLDTIAKEEFIYRSRCKDGVYQQPEKMGNNVNIGRARFNAFIAPDESFIIVPSFGMPDTFGGTDYYIVFRDANDNWSKPMNMGPAVNSKNPKEWSASLSPDGKFLFFMSARMGENKMDELTRENFINLHNSPQNGNSDIYWISTSVIEVLRKKAIFE